ncbi:hypothetical protein PICSAR138_04589 [Mycobacterium avium subsp. paratuberculosis]|nr:hypothetical protein PICSAR138_04589 [Mycobacterium avium subsp. paratuberculosis]
MLYSGIGIHGEIHNKINPTTRTIPGTVFGSKLNRSSVRCPRVLDLPIATANQVPSSTAMVEAAKDSHKLIISAFMLGECQLSSSL